MVNLRTFDLNLLRVFEAVMRDRSVSKAADQLGLSQPAVSSALNRMRRQFEDPLFVRGSVGMEPTAKAMALSPVVSESLTMLRAGLSATSSFDPAISKRQFTLLMTDVGEIAFLPKVLPLLKERSPGIDLSVVEFGMERYEELLDSGAADLAVGRLKLPDTLRSQTIHLGPYVVVASASHPRIRRGTDGTLGIDLQDYLAAEHVQVMPRGATGDPVTEALGEQAGLRRIALSIPHAVALPMIIGATELIATVPKVFADYLIDGGTVRQMPTPFTIETSVVKQWWHRRNENDPGHRWLRSAFAGAGA